MTGSFQRLGDRMKAYESVESNRRLMPTLPIIARLDGRAFHTFTSGMERPFDSRLRSCMVIATRQLVEETGASMGYVQSDEVTLAWHHTTHDSQMYFNGRIAKLTSVLAASMTLHFYRALLSQMAQYSDRCPTFDARVWNVPTREEAANVFLWREWDATKNSITMAAEQFYGPDELHGLNSNERQELLFQKGVNWNDYPPEFKRGTYLQRRTIGIPFQPIDASKLPPKHAYHTNPDLRIERSVCGPVPMPPFGTVVNREEVVFDGKRPIVETQVGGIIIRKTLA